MTILSNLISTLHTHYAQLMMLIVEYEEVRGERGRRGEGEGERGRGSEGGRDRGRE